MLFAWLALLPSSARAHTGTVRIRGEYDWSALPDAEPYAWNVWEFYPTIIIGVFGMLALYAALAGPLRERWKLSDVGPERSDWGWFVGSLVLLFFSLQGPLHEMSDIYLFSGHMVQHLLLTLVFPPMWIRGIPPWMWRPLVELPGVMTIGKVLIRPVVAGFIATGTLYFWHVPAMYEWAMMDHNVHIAEHLAFIVSAVIMWWPAYSRLDVLPRLNPGMRMVYLFCLTLPMKALGAVITVSDYILYPFYSTQPRMFGLDPMTDQRIGGLIMWLPGGLVFWITIGVVFFSHFYADIKNARGGPPKGAADSTPAGV